MTEAIETILVNETLEVVKFADRESALKEKQNMRKNIIIAFVRQFSPSVPNLKSIIMNKWHNIEKQPLVNICA